jgi:replication factor C small subunit
MIDCTANSGLRDVRDNIRGFARGSRTNKGDLRWVILEHADALTADTQAFLRRMMETTAANTRFLFECCDAGAIAEPILSRSTLFTVNRPDDTEMRYEIMRRTDYALSEDVIASLICRSRGNVRMALLSALAIRWTSGSIDDHSEYANLVKCKPTSLNPQEWILWALKAETECRLRGLDMRELLEYGWPNNRHVAYMRQQWSRLGGISTRALFFRCVSGILNSGAAVKQQT